MTMPMLGDYRRAWEDCPPLRRMVAAFVGIEPKKRSNDLGELLAMFPGGVVK